MDNFILGNNTIKVIYLIIFRQLFAVIKMKNYKSKTGQKDWLNKTGIDLIILF